MGKEPPPHPSEMTVDLPVGRAPGEAGLAGQAGTYRLVSILGQGGFADVYLAEQVRPVRRKVAVKLLRPGRDSSQILARFEVERQALALMDHPNVATVLDAGTTSDGRPYFVMEYVRGVPLIEHCDRQRLAAGVRLRLFLQVCAAIQHAHQKGVIHRDIKPSNVLVAVGEGAPLVKVIDFGVAKAIGSRLTDRTLVTEPGQLIGTPEYMSPEQIESTAQDIDTRSDIYSLGVLLYELLTGTLPFDSRRLRGTPRSDVLRLVREEEPPRPSTRVVADEEGGAREQAALRDTDPASLSRDLRGDIDWITMKAMAKDRTRRYSAVSELSADLERHLHHQPVSAGPPGAAYHFRKFVRRNRVLVGAAATVLAVLTAGIVATATFAVRESRARANAEAQSAKARAAIDYLRTMLTAADPSRAGRDVHVLEVVDRAADDLERGALTDPDVEATVRTALGATYLGLGHLDKAELHLRRGLELRRQEYGDDSLEVADSLANLGWLEMARDRPREAEKLLRAGLEVFRRELGGVHPRVADTMHELAVVLQQAGHLEEAEEMYRASLATSRALPHAAAEQIARTMSRLGSLLALRGEQSEAEKLQREALEMVRGVGGTPHVSVIDITSNLSWLLQQTGRPSEAEALAREALALAEELHGPESAATAQTLVVLASAQQAEGQLEGAETSLRRALANYRSAYGDHHSFVGATLDHLAGVLDQQRRGDEAAEIYPAVIDIYRQTYGAPHWMVGNARGRYGMCLTRLGRVREAETELLASFQNLSAAGMDDRAATTAGHLADLYARAGRKEEAARWADRAKGSNQEP